ncbi:MULTISPECIES: vWA domain-containing protein [Legionella]|uniref:vWA domain-containing protein n=1 Tax=Legionella TaxID=445 RepID=UPI000F8C45DF|nr:MULTISPECIES: VWA domain-containing protein [Legionella]MCP0914945.1 VWA domain-containing protein [Legionella sp. 27cVA30]RUQ93532.1 VWA domain-containing protein [Legionella septentrionalis]RUR09550.1 VWA domain-containing protein [Legionella septentrionalis]RUR16351.1 VWA domain-containing protein [Legionella septentrionalis]
MMAEFHFMRPGWLLAFLPLLFLFWALWRKTPAMQAWQEICDSHLLTRLMQQGGKNTRTFALLSLIGSACFMVVSLAGPSWSRLPVPTFKPVEPRVILLDMSETMLHNDLPPNRLERAKFKLHDLFQDKRSGQFGLIVYSGEPFIVSPLTDDAQTIDALLASLTADVMPVEGQQLDTALREADKLITQAGFNQGDILVLTGTAPSPEAVGVARDLLKKGTRTSIIPITNTAVPAPFKELAAAGQGILIPFADTSNDIEEWLAFTKRKQKFTADANNDIPVWKDNGRWFLIPALLCLLPAFRRGWLQRFYA